MVFSQCYTDPGIYTSNSETLLNSEHSSISSAKLSSVLHFYPSQQQNYYFKVQSKDLHTIFYLISSPTLLLLARMDYYSYF